MNDLRSQNRTLAPVRPIGPKTGEIVSAKPRKRSNGNPLFRDSRPSRSTESGEPSEPVDSVDDEPEISSVDEPALTFPVSRDLNSMPVSASSNATAPTEISDEADESVEEEADDGRQSGKAKGRKAPASRPTRRREVLDLADQEDDKFPWHYQFDDDEPEELQAKTPLLSRAFRSSVG